MTFANLRYNIEPLIQPTAKWVVPEKLKAAAVLLLLVNRPIHPTVVFTKRTMAVATHKGEISLPGGMKEPSDQTPFACAARETWEEIGIPRSKIEPLGQLSPIETVSGFEVTPIIGSLDHPLPYYPEKTEVDVVFEVPLIELLQPDTLKPTKREFAGRFYIDHRFESDFGTIWGVTGNILHQFKTTLLSSNVTWSNFC